MAITGLIPQTKMPIDSFNSQLEQLMQQIARHRQTNNQSRQLDETSKYHGQDIALRQAAGRRAEQQMDPMFKVNQIKAMLEGLRGMANGNQQGTDQGMQDNSMPPLSPDNSGNPGVSAEGPGMITEGSPFVGRAGYKPPQGGQHNMNQEISPGITLEDITRHALGLPARKAPVETPQQKQQRAVDTAMQKEETKIRFQAKKDIPHLQAALKSIKQLKQIASEDADLFGHYVKPELWAKTTRNKNAGIFQNLLADQIAGLESKLSSKGNIVALKMASQLKPSFSEQQEVALGKIESMEKQIQDALATSLAEANKQSDNNESDENSDPLGLFGG